MIANALRTSERATAREAEIAPPQERAALSGVKGLM